MYELDWGLNPSLGQMFAPGEVRELVKALSAGADITNPGAIAGSGFALRMESLDMTMKSLVHKESDLVAFRDFPKKAAENTIQEFMQLRSVGNEEGVFNAEGDLPIEDDSTWARMYTVMKYMGVTKRVTHPMAILKAQPLPEGVVAAEAKSATLKLLRAIELKLWDGDSTACTVEFDGFFRKWVDGICGYAVGASNAAGSTAWHADLDTVLATNLMQDLRWGSMSEDIAADMVTYVSEDPNYGRPTDIYYPFTAHKDFSKQFYPKERSNGLVHEGKAGVAIRSWISPFGELELKPAMFLRQSQPANQLGLGAAGQRPATPTVLAAASPALAGGFPGFGGTTQSRICPATVDGAGTYAYQVVACNHHGKSVPVSTTVAVTLGDMVTLQMQDNSPAPVTEWYEVYRSLPGGGATTARFIFRARRTAAVQTITDFNRFIPGTSRAFFIQRDEQALAWYQLLPLLKMNLAVIDPTIRFCLLLYGALEIFAPRKHAVAINIGPLV